MTAQSMNRKQDRPLEERRYRAQVIRSTGVNTGDYISVKTSMYTTKENDSEHMKKYLGEDGKKIQKLETMKKCSAVRKKTTVKKGSQKTVTMAKIVRTANAKCKGNCGTCSSCKNLKSPEYHWKRI